MKFSIIAAAHFLAIIANNTALAANLRAMGEIMVKADMPGAELSGNNDNDRQLQSSCTDKHELCSHWASRSECTWNPDYMLSYCQQSCGECINVGREYIFKKAGSAFCLDVPGAKVGNMRKLQLYDCIGTPSQKFIFDSSGRLRSAIDNKYCVEMDPKYGVFLHTACLDSWEFSSTEDSGVFIKNTRDDMCIASTEAWEHSNGEAIKRGFCDSDFSPESEWSLF